MKDIERFLSKVNKTDYCWLWKAYKNKEGYGTIRWNGKMWKAHRMSFVIFNGKTNGFLVLHKCDNPSCVNPKHLFLGTDKDNCMDRISKGRSHRPIGTKNNKAILNDEDVKKIRRLFGKIRRSEIAKMFNVKISTIDDIKYKRRWLHVSA